MDNTRSWDPMARIVIMVTFMICDGKIGDETKRVEGSRFPHRYARCGTCSAIPRVHNKENSGDQKCHIDKQHKMLYCIE